MRGEALLGTRLDIYDEQVPPIEDCYYDYSCWDYHLPYAYRKRGRYSLHFSRIWMAILQPKECSVGGG